MSERITTNKEDDPDYPWSATLHTEKHGNWHGYGATENEAIEDAKRGYAETMEILLNKSEDTHD